MPATGWTNHDAAVAVARRTDIPAADRKAALAMLDILGPDQYCPEHDETHATIAPDEQRPVSSATQLSIHGSTNSLDNKPTAIGSSTRASTGPALNGRLCPPGLAAAIQSTPPATGPAQAVSEVAPAVGDNKPPKPAQPRRGQRIPIEELPPIPDDAHGTYRGVSLHRRREELSCRACKDFKNAQQRQARAARAARAAHAA